MPHYVNAWEGTSIQLDADNVFNGTLVDKDATDDTTMRWEGYTCQLYDGELKMCPVRGSGGGAADATITGVCNGVAFKFRGTTMEYGVWPGFLSLSKSV